MKKIILNLTKISVCVICVCLLGLVAVEASQYRLGDVDLKNRVNANDALLVLQDAASLYELSDYERFVADVNKDGQVNSIDALQILKVAAKVDIFKIEVELTTGEEYVIDKIYDVGAYRWNYEVNSDSGILVEKTVKDLPEDSAPGNTPEQVYTISAQAPGIYEVHFKLRQSWDKGEDIADECMYIISVKE